MEIPFNVETFTIDINNIRTSSATLELIWEKTYIAVPFEVPTDEKVLTSINDALNGEPKSDDFSYTFGGYVNLLTRIPILRLNVSLARKRYKF